MTLVLGSKKGAIFVLFEQNIPEIFSSLPRFVKCYHFSSTSGTILFYQNIGNYTRGMLCSKETGLLLLTGVTF